MHQQMFKACVAADIRRQMIKVDIVLGDKRCMCLAKMLQVKGFRFRNVQFLGEELREPIDEEGLSSCLPMQRLDDFGFKRLSHLGGILPEQFLHLRQREVGQMKFLLDVERRNRPIIIQLRDVLDTDDADTIGTPPVARLGDIDAAERMKKPHHRLGGDAVKFVYQEDNPLRGEQAREVAKKPSHGDMVGELRAC